MGDECPPMVPGFITARFYDRATGLLGVKGDPSAFWAYCTALPRAGDRVTRPDGEWRIVHRAVFATHPVPGGPTGVRTVLLPHVELDPITG